MIMNSAEKARDGIDEILLRGQKPAYLTSIAA